MFILATIIYMNFFILATAFFNLMYINVPIKCWRMNIQLCFSVEGCGISRVGVKGKFSFSDEKP